MRGLLCIKKIRLLGPIEQKLWGHEVAQAGVSTTTSTTADTILDQSDCKESVTVFSLYQEKKLN